MRRIALVLVSLIAFAPAPSAQAPASDRPVPYFADPSRPERLATAFETIRAAVPTLAKEIGAPAVVWGVVIDGRLAASGAYGLRDVEAEAPATLDTVFRIASMTKSFTALAILKLRDEGRLSLDDPVVKHIPGFASVALPTRDSAPITIRQLMSHSAGFAEDNAWGDRQLAQPDATLDQWLARGLPFSTAPGTAYEYSNYGFALLGRIVATVARRPYAEYMNTQILAPLGMTASYWDAADVPAAHIAHGYRRDGDAWVRETPLAHGSFGPMGGLWTSGHDLAKYIAYMLAAWPPRDAPERGPVRRASMREMQQAQRASGFSAVQLPPAAHVEAQATAYGFGLRTTVDCRFPLAVAHSGGLPGYGSNMTWLPEHGVGVFALANVTYAPAGRITRMMIDALHATGALQPRRLPPSAPLLSARDAIAAFLNEPSEARLQAVAADNLALDRPLADRVAAARRLRDALGTCKAGDIAAQNWLRGTFRADCERGWIDVRFTLAPTQPPRLQVLELREGRPVEPDLRRRLEALFSSGPGSPDALPFASDSLRDEFASTASVLRMAYGQCRPGEALSGDGARQVRMRLQCDRGDLVADIRRDADGRVSRLGFEPPPGAACAP
ncbi:MAG TPA: serine hydrolase domain-containing protein [Vicinamibacterales bacterium]